MNEKQRVKKAPDPSSGTALTFESSLDELEKTIDRLEDGDLTLDGSLELFEKGVSLIRTCDAHLKKTRGRITELLRGENGELVEKILGDSLESFITKEATDD